MKRSTQKTPSAEKPSGHPLPMTYQKRRPRRGIHTDLVHPGEYLKYEGRFYCEDCSHFDSNAVSCTMGYKPVHTRAEQTRLYDLSGRMAFCRFIEID